MKEFRLVKISAGTPLERGVQYGRQAAGEIATCIGTYRERFQSGRGLGWEAVRQMAMAHLPYAKDLMPDIVEEAEGVARGAGVDFEDIMALNCRYEILHYPREGECTAFALTREATADGKVYVGQNWDQRPSLLQHSLILDITEEENGNRIIGTTEAGQLIRNGINVTRGVAQCANSLHSSLDSAGAGVPSNFLRRKVLTLGCMEEMVALLRGAKRAVSNNFCIGTRENLVADIEGVPGLAVRLDPVGGILTHANNLLVNTDLDTYRNERFRGDRLYQLLALERGHITLDYIKTCLRDHHGYPEGICSHITEENRTWQTIASIIYGPDDNKAWICCGNPCENEYKEYSL